MSTGPGAQSTKTKRHSKGVAITCANSVCVFGASAICSPSWARACANVRASPDKGPCAGPITATRRSAGLGCGLCHWRQGAAVAGVVAACGKACLSGLAPAPSQRFMICQIDMPRCFCPHPHCTASLACLAAAHNLSFRLSSYPFRYARCDGPCKRPAKWRAFAGFYWGVALGVGGHWCAALGRQYQRAIAQNRRDGRP